LNRVKGFRIAAVAAAVIAGSVVMPSAQRPVDAATTQTGADDAGAKSYAAHCAICHGDHREGNLPAFPPLAGIGHRMTDDQLAMMIHKGKGRMPGFPDLNGGELSGLEHFLTTAAEPVTAAANEGGEAGDEAKAGSALFRQNCGFCHGRDAMGGETGPDLTASKLVKGDKTGEQIATVIREGRPNNRMPSFNFSSQEVASLIAFIRARGNAAALHPGGRRGVSIEDLQTGNVAAGKAYFEGPGGCVKCHSASGDLAGIAKRYEGLQLEMRMLYPRDAKSTLTVTLPSGEKITGTLAYHDEFTIALRDATGQYRSWAVNRVHFTVDEPVKAHEEQFPKYSDADVHNLMAYLQTLK
jgi:mono/diheme cytochrome c family protein